MKALLELRYNDGSAMNVTLESKESSVHALADFMMIARGTLNASMAVKSTLYDDEGFTLVQ